jgi:uncharacterized BrkB/YihY/UPF0761 family membrane protein
MAAIRETRYPRWYAIPVRVALVTLICTLLAFAISLMLGIVGTVVIAALRHVNPNMTIAYRYVALPTALVAGVIIFALALVMEIRHYRQSKSLAAIARLTEQQHSRVAS